MSKMSRKTPLHDQGNPSLGGSPKASPKTLPDQETEDAQVYESIKDENLSREIEVREIPDNASEESLLNFFENKRRGGGPVNKIQYDQAAHTAIVIFESPESVTEILKKQPCRFLGKTMLVSVRATQPVPAKRTTLNNAENSKETDTTLSIYVSGFKQETTEDALIYYFENKKRTGGGDISSHQMNREEGYIIITFVHSSDAAEVMKRSHTLNDVTLIVRPYIIDDKMILVTGLTGKLGEETLQNFMEAKTKAEIQSITFNDGRTKAVVEFQNPCDLNTIKHACAKYKLEGIHLTVCPVPICNCIKVTNLPSGVSEDTLTNYFENKRRSGGGAVESVELNHSVHVCLVSFKDHQVVGEVCKKSHEIEKTKVAVQPYHICLSRPGGNKAKVVPEPIPITHFELDKRKFFMKNDSYRNKLENEMAEFYSKVIWPSEQSDEVLLECTLSSDAEDYMSLVETWAEKCLGCFKNFLDTLQSKVFESNSEEWALRLEQLGKLSVSHPDKVTVFVESTRYTVTFVGDKAVMPEVIKQVEEAFAAKQITKNCRVKKWEAKYLLAVSFPDEVIDQDWDVNVQIHDEAVDLTGVENSVNEVALQMHSRLEKIVTTRETMAQDMLIFLQKENVRNQVSEKLKMLMKINYPWEVKDGRLILYASTEEETHEMKKILESMIETFSTQLEKETSRILNNPDWKKLKEKLNTKFPDQIHISDNKSGEVSVFSLPGIIGDVRKELEGFFAENTVYHEVLMLDEGVVRFIQTHAKAQVDQFVQDAPRGKTLKINFESIDKIAITGTKENLKALKEKIMELKKQIQKQQRTIQKPGIKLYIKTAKGKECIEKAEKEAKCVIELKDIRKQRGEEDSKSRGEWQKPKDFSKLTKCALVKLSWGVEVKVFGGDMTDLNVDVMVNAANSGLDHGGGLAADIVRKGGNKIQEECSEHVKKNGNLSDGDVFISSAGTLNCKAIAHAVGPVWKDGKSGEPKILEKAISSCLQEAKKMNAKSVAFPALSAGIFGFPPEQACACVVNTIFSFFDEQKGDAGMKEVYVCNFSRHCVSYFIQALEKKMGRDKIQVLVDLSQEGLSSISHQADDDDAEDQDDVLDENTSMAATELKFGQAQIKLVKAVLAKEYSDVIVNSATKELNLDDGQLSKALLKEGGNEIQEECNSSYPNGIQYGDVAITGAGKLPSKKIFHVPLAHWDGNQDSAPAVKDVVLKCLDEANKLKMKSISFPPIGAGGRKYPKELVAKEMLQAMHDFCQKNQTTSIRNIRIAVYYKDSKIFQEFEDVKRIWLQRQGGSGGESMKRPTKSKSWRTSKKVTDDKREFMIEKLKVCIYEGDITEEKADVIVNGSNGNLDLRKGIVSRAILAKAGGGIIPECRSQKVAMLNDGVAVTSGGNMKCKNIVHILAQESAHTWKPYILRSLLMAKVIKAQSVAFPALGTGRGCTAEEMAEAMLDTIRDFLAQVKGKHHIQELRIVIFQGDMVPAYLTKFAEAFSDRREFMIEKLKVCIYDGDITEENADVIVNGSNGDLDLRKGKVSRAILKKAGNGLISELKSQQAAMSSNGVAITSGGNMQCKHIVHILAQESAHTWKPYILKSLQVAESVRARSVVFPALGTGRGCTAEEMAVIMLDTIRDFLTQIKGKHHMKELRIVIFQEDMVPVYLRKFAGVVSAGGGTDMAAKSKKDSDKSGPFQGDSNLNVVMFADSKQDIDKAIRIVEMTMDSEWTCKPIADAGIRHLKPTQRDEILKTGKENNVYLKIDEKQGEIQMMGFYANVMLITDKIHQILREQVQKYHEHKEAQLLKNIVKWFYIKDRKEVEFPVDQNMLIENAYKVKNKSIKLQGRSGEEFEIDLEKMVERPVKDPQKKFPVIRRDLVKDAIQVENPKHWTDMKSTENLKVVPLQPSGPEYTKVVKEFQQSVGGQRQIVKMERIQNVTLYTQYMAKMKQLNIQNNHKKNERILWHGTAVEAVDSINNHGFNRSYCGKNAVAIGNGVYFAVAAAYSAQDTYSRPDGQRHRRMYQCRVLTGDFAQGGGGMRVPPQKSSTQAHILYDSVVDNVQSPNMFVIFHDAQAYPEYLITFT